MTTYSAVPHRTLLALFLALSASLLLFSAGTASAASPIAKDGKIHACYKAKGKGKGALRIAHGSKARCPKQWRKVAWQAIPTRGPRGQVGPPGPAGQPGLPGLPGVPGVDADAAILELENKVASLRLKVEALEGVLGGISNQELLGAIELTPLVQVLCTRTGVLTDRLNLLEGVLGGLSLNGVLTTLGGLLNIPALPGALPAFSCPTP